MFYVYEWFIVETGEIIYVGKGCKNRYKVRKHNMLFNELVRRFECESRIIRHFYNEKDAFAFEYDRINELQSIGQCKCNIRKGGFGGESDGWTQEKREKYSRNNVMKAAEQRKRMSERNPMKNPEIAQKTNAKKQRKVVINGVLYKSVKFAAESLNVAEYTVITWCHRGYDTKGKPCRYFDEPQKDYPDMKRTHPKVTTSKAVFVDGIRYETVKDAADDIGVWSESIIRAIKANRPCKGHECRYDNQQPSRGKSDNSTTEGSTTNE